MIHKRDSDDDEDVSPSVPLFKLKGWGDVFAIMSVCGMLIAGLAWGLKLEARNDTLTLQVQGETLEITELKDLVKTGMLPVTAERMAVIQQNDRELSLRVNALERDCFNHKDLDRDGK